jgi:hypothetical protein
VDINQQLTVQDGGKQRSTAENRPTYFNTSFFLLTDYRSLNLYFAV